MRTILRKDRLFFLHLVFLVTLPALGEQEVELRSKPNPWVSGTLGAIIPGAGYLYNGNSTKAALALPMLAGMLLPIFISPKDSTGTTLKFGAFLASRNSYGFSVYDSFQDAVDINGRPPLSVNNLHYSAGDLLQAPFQLRNYSPKKVWVPLAVLGGLGGLAVMASQIKSPVSLTPEKIILGIPLLAAMTTIIGAGEEADFRGFYYPALSELTGSIYVGAFLQALMFGYVHTDWYGTGFPLFTGGAVKEITRVSQPDFGASTTLKFVCTFLGGLQHAWITSSEEEGLLKSVASHAAWDFIALSISLLAFNEAPPILYSIRF